MSGPLDSLRIPQRSCLALAMGREEKALRFCVMRDTLDLRACCSFTWLGAHLEDTGNHSWLYGSNMERERWQSLLTAMVERYVGTWESLDF